MKNTIIGILAVVIIGLGIYVMTKSGPDTYVNENDPTNEDVPTENGITNVPDDDIDQVDEQVDDSRTVVGSSVNGTDITAYHYGGGDTEVLFVGGIHGGYSWNTALVAYELMDYLEENPTAVPENVRVTVIPVMNPDGLERVVGTTDRFVASDVSTSDIERVSGRFNENDVDLNRNFDCEWQENATWQNRTVSGGDAPFSEPESNALRRYVVENEPDAAIVWYSAAGGVFASNCRNGVLSETTELTNLYAKASGYRAYESFDFYEITGDMVNWMAKNDIPAISVLLTNHDDVEWSKNKAGIDAVLEYYAE